MESSPIASGSPVAPHSPFAPRPIIYVLDDDVPLGHAVARLLRRNGYAAEAFPDVAALRQAHAEEQAHCVVTDVVMDDMDGFRFADWLRAHDPAAAIVFMTAWPATAAAVDAVRHHGGIDYLEKPIDEIRLLAAVAEGVAWSMRHHAVATRTDKLTPREREVMELLVQGYSNKMIALELGLSPKTVEDHRAAIMAKTGAKGLGLAELIALTRA